jgi:hypothetical protein
MNTLNPTKPDYNEYEWYDDDDDDNNERQKGRVTRGYDIKCITTWSGQSHACVIKNKKTTGKKQ